MRINQLVNTPIGEGRVQGGWEDGRVLVRLPVNEQTKDHLADKNCQTPAAVESGLWVFSPADLK